MKPICKKCIRDLGDRCEAFRDEYMRIYDKVRCDDFDDGACHTITVESTYGEDDYSKMEYIFRILHFLCLLKPPIYI